MQTNEAIKEGYYVEQNDCNRFSRFRDIDIADGILGRAFTPGWHHVWTQKIAATVVGVIVLGAGVYLTLLKKASQ